MSQLKIFHENAPSKPILDTLDRQLITASLRKINVRFEAWNTNKIPKPNDDEASILQLFQAEINEFIKDHAYQSYDVVHMTPDHPEKLLAREKFLTEHIHKEDEIRFFVRGQGLFTLHINNKIYSILCEQNDLISVPANLKHWFDMGQNPDFTVIRIFDNPKGWVAHYTGDDIAKNFATLEN